MSANPRTFSRRCFLCGVGAGVAGLANTPALDSYFITDEPNAAAFLALGKLVAYLRERDPAHLAYINLFPTTLAYGGQGISCYVYCCKGHTGGIALADGTPTPLYHALTPLNREFVAIAKELQPLRSLAVYHAGMSPPGSEPLPPNAPFRFDPPVAPLACKPPEPVRGFLLGYFGMDDKPSHVIAVNLDYKAEAAVVLAGPGGLQAFDAASGAWSGVSGAHLELRLPPGGGKLVRVEKSRYRRMTITRKGDVVVVRFVDRELRDEDLEIGEELVRLVNDEPEKKILLDLGAVEHLSDAALGRLIRVERRARALNKAIKLCNVRGSIRDVFAVTKLADHFDIVANCFWATGPGSARKFLDRCAEHHLIGMPGVERTRLTDDLFTDDNYAICADQNLPLYRRQLEYYRDAAGAKTILFYEYREKVGSYTE